MGGVEGTYVEEQLLIMHRNGYPEETYYTYSYTPDPRRQRQGRRHHLREHRRHHARHQRPSAVHAARNRRASRRRAPLARCLRTRRRRAGDQHARRAVRAAVHARRRWPHAVARRVRRHRARTCGRTGARFDRCDRRPGLSPHALGVNDMHVVDDLRTRFADPLPMGAWSESPSRAALLAHRAGRTKRSQRRAHRRTQSVPPVRCAVSRFPEPRRRTDRRRDRQCRCVRIRTPARRSAGRTRSLQDRVLLQPEPRVPHAADADARSARGIADECRRVAGERTRAREDRPSQQPASAQAGQLAARFRAHRSRPRAGVVPAHRS